MDASLLADLGASKLTPADLGAREAGASELAAVNIESRAVKGYVIPYFDINGDPIAFYRIKLLDYDPKYKQPKNSLNHIYYPKTFSSALLRTMTSKDRPSYIILTEGEKKAAAATKAGFPTVAVGGVDNWRNRTIVLPGETKLTQGYSGNGSQTIRAQLPSTTSTIEEASTFATGLQSLIDLISQNNLNLIIVYDSDKSNNPQGLKPEVQRAAAALGYEMRYQGIPVNHIRQMILPNGTSGKSKVGLDDYLVQEGPEALQELIDATLEARSAFPKHPNTKAFVNNRLQKGKLTRKDAQNLSMAILTELDAGGRRLRSKTSQQLYYFDEQDFNLMPVALMYRHGEPLHESIFGKFLYERFGLSAGDSRVITWLATQFTGEAPVEETEPSRVMAIVPENPDEIAVQISDSHFVIISGSPKQPLRIHTNGSEGLLFEQGHVDRIDPEILQEAFKKQNSKTRIKPWWNDVLSTVNLNLAGSKGPNDPREVTTSKKLASLLFYASPWLHRWRGTQLPVEIIVGEAGSGKSSLYSLRLSILTGKPFLRNIPSDLRDWHASVTNTGGLHVIDNVQFTNKDLRQRLSDEICRIVTEPNPHVEMRKLYTTSTQVQVPVKANFAMTAIQQPFHNSDLIQRAAIFELSALNVPHDGSWVGNQLEKFGGRESWLAHHLVVIHRFLKAVTIDGDWNTEYNAVHRLNNYEQVLQILADILGMGSDWIPEKLSEATQTTLSEADWALEGLKEFASEQGVKAKFTASDIAMWAQGNEEFSDNLQLTNSRRLGRYMQSHKRAIERTANIVECGVQGNRKQFRVDH